MGESINQRLQEQRSHTLPVWVKRVGLSLLTLVLIGAAIGFVAIRQTQFVPDFYAHAAIDSPTRPPSPVDGDLPTGVSSRLLPKVGPWQATFNDRQINAWLAAELPRMFPRLQASGARDPRICIEGDRVLAAVRYQNRRVDVVVSCELRVALTECPNMLAVRVERLRIGALPVSLRPVQSLITREAAKGGVDIRWDETDEGPIALAIVPAVHPKYSRSPVIIESVSLTDGKLFLAGRNGVSALTEYQPQGPVYRFVSYGPGENLNRQQSRVSTASSPPTSVWR